MFIELAVIGGVVATYKNLFSDKAKIKKRFNESMEGMGLKNKQQQSFTIKNIIRKDYGYNLIVNIPYGLSLEHLNSKLNILEDNLNAIINLEKDKFKTNINMRVINKDISKFMFEPVKCPSDKLYLGKNYLGENFLLDINTNPMLLIAGATGFGKSMLLSCILTNLIYNHPKDVEIYLTQLIKGEISSFEDCIPVKKVAYNVTDLIKTISLVRRKIDERTKLFRMHGIRNIKQWNKHYRKNRMKRVFLICEEMSELMELDVWEQLWGVVKAGRSVGIHLIGALQRTTATNLNTDVKSQMTRCTFHQNSVIDSQNVINSNNAMNLRQGECIICGTEGEVKIKVPYIDDDFVILNKYVPEIRIPSRGEVRIIKTNRVIATTPMIEEPVIIDVDPKEIKEENYKKKLGIVTVNNLEGEDIC